MRTYKLANPPMRGNDLKPLQGYLRGIDLYNGKIDGIFGAGTGHACLQARWRLGYPKAFVVAVGDQRLLDYLAGDMQLPAAYRLRRHQRGFGIDKNQKIRDLIVANGKWGIANEPRIHYSQGAERDDFLRAAPRHLPLTTDCSGFVTACYKWAGAPDPNGLNYNVVGFTGTLLDHGRWVPLAEIKPADLVIWGPYPGHHTAVALEHAKDPELSSHGSEGGPKRVTLSAETAAQHRGYQIRRYLD